MKQASVIMAAFIYNAATIDQKIPRKTPATPESPRDNRRPCGRCPVIKSLDHS